jgi:VanZ family protein
MKDYRVWLGGLMYFGLIVPVSYSSQYKLSHHTDVDIRLTAMPSSHHKLSRRESSFNCLGQGQEAKPSLPLPRKRKHCLHDVARYNFNAIQTQLRSVPPWAVSFCFSLIIAVFSDWFRHRALFAILPLCLSITGFGILISVHNNTDLEYAALFLVVMGTYGAMPIIVCWFNMNLGGHHRRSIGTAWQIGFGNIGGIIATYAFLDADAPYYKKGYSICIAFTALSGLASVVYLATLVIENRRRAKSVRDVGLSDYEKTELGDLNSEFRYMY